jgi:hypothetical protein
MHDPQTDSIIAEIRSVLEVTAFNPAPEQSLIDDVERSLGVQLPQWLRAVYRSCNGFQGPTGTNYLYPLDGHDGVLEFTLFLRKEEWAPAWIERAIIFGDNGVGGSIITHWVALDGRLIEWCIGDGDRYALVENDLFALWKREQERWDAVREGSTGHGIPRR